MLKIVKLTVSLWLIFFALTGCDDQMNSKKVYIYETMGEEKVDITDYYQTGLYYIYTNPQKLSSQKIIRKQRPLFWSRETILKQLNNEETLYLPRVATTQEILKKIIENNADFSEKMQYYSSYVSIRGDLNELFIGYFELNKQPYTVGITNSSYMVNELGELTIDIDNDFISYPSTYEQLLEEASKQPQPDLAN